MTHVSIRRIEGPALADAIYAVQSYAYHAQLPLPPKEEWTKGLNRPDGTTFYAVYEGGQPVCVGASGRLTQNVRGKLYPASAIGGVASLPAARRKGYVRQMMADLLAEVRAAGAVFSDLWPFRESFYNRMGYVLFPPRMTASFSPEALAPLLKMAFGGTLELLQVGEVVDDVRAFFEAQRACTHGMALFDFLDREKFQSANLWAALVKFDGQVEGLMLYNMVNKEGTGQLLKAEHFFYDTSRARMSLLQWIARHIDQIGGVELNLRLNERPLAWLPDINAKTQTGGWASMGRVLDVRAIGGMHVGSGSFAARISDPLCPFNEGVWRFESHAGTLQVTPGGQPDCDLTIQGLTALVFGTHDPQDLPLLGWGSPPPAAQASLRAMFPLLTPYLHEEF